MYRREEGGDRRQERRQESGDRRILPEYGNKENLKGKWFIIILLAAYKWPDVAALKDVMESDVYAYRK